jgi:hypothetical protein
MIPASLDFAKEAQEVNFTQASHLGHVQFGIAGIAQERLNIVHVVLPRAN